MGRSPCCSKVGLRRGPWSTKEDTLLTNYIQQHGEGLWKSLPNKAGLLRCGKSCRLRWMNYLRPGIKRGNISQDEEDLIVRLHRLLGNRWSLIAGRLPGRTDNEIKNYWNTYLIKKLNINAGLMHPKSHDKDHLSKSKRKKKQKKVTKKKLLSALGEAKKNITSDHLEHEINSTNDHNDNDPPKTKVYMPKAIRVSLRTASYDSLVSQTSSNEPVAMEWPTLSELVDANYGGGGEDDFLGLGCINLPNLVPTDDENMWEKFYEEYLQLV